MGSQRSIYNRAESAQIWGSAETRHRQGHVEGLFEGLFQGPFEGTMRAGLWITLLFANGFNDLACMYQDYVPIANRPVRRYNRRVDQDHTHEGAQAMKF